MTNNNILSKRYATKEINKIFSEKGKILLERKLWIALMKAQKKLGLDISSKSIKKYESAKDNINLKRINEIEQKTKHDVKAKIEAFVEVANAEENIHKGMTSRDLTDNVEQMQIMLAAKIIFGKYLSILKHMLDKSNKYKDIVLTARTHHQPAQATLLGRRMAMWAEELLFHLEKFEKFIENYPLRGIKGPIGTQFDMLTLLGSREKVKTLENKVANELGFTKILSSPGQIYPRSLDFKLISNLLLLSSACENFAKGMRLMAGYELVTEGFKKGQVGSSAMPHKMNTRSSERICGFGELLKMYADGASRLLGDQWEEGDISCSVVRRVIIPDSFYASDGLCETSLTVLNNMGTYDAIINKEINRYLPFLATTEILMIAIKSGLGRETSHKIIKKYAIGEALRMRQKNYKENKLSELLTNDPKFVRAGITKKRIDNIISNKYHFIGNAKKQIASITKKAKKLLDKYSEQIKYKPKDIL